MAENVLHEPVLLAAEHIPDSIDWTTKNVVTPVKNQGQCGSCWAFAGVASIESQVAIKTGKLVSLSDQNVIDCSESVGNAGCNGGWVDKGYQVRLFRYLVSISHPVLQYVIRNRGIDSEASYPYKWRKEECHFDAKTNATSIAGYQSLWARGEEFMKQVVATIGPIAVLIDASSGGFKGYRSGVLHEPNCANLNHAVLVVGYGELNGVKYWKVKNSWGSGYGDNGYILMERDFNNMCHIADYIMYPTF